MKNVKTLFVAAFIAVSMAGCSTAPAATATPVPTPAPPALQVVNVSLTTYSIKFTPDKIKPGEVKFVVKNEAKDLNHELILVKTSLAFDKLPMNSEGAQVDEESKDYTKVGSVEDIEPGKDGAMTVMLEAGRYVYFCNTPTHYAMKMRGEFTVAP